MNLWQRLGIAARFLRQGKSAFEIIPTWQEGSPTYSAGNFESNVRYGYRLNELIFSCVSLKADSAAAASLKVYQKKDHEQVEGHPASVILNNPNPHMTQFEFISATLIYLDLAGKAYWEKVRTRGGQVAQLWPLRPDWVAPIRSKAFIAGYEYRVPGFPDKITLAPQDVLHFSTWDPLDMYGGLAPVTVAARVGDVDNASTDFLKMFFEKGGTPMGVLTSKQSLVEAQTERIRELWRTRYGGYKNWQEPIVLDNDASYQRIGLSFAEMGFDELDARSEARICMVLKVPPILVGAKVGLDRSTFSNYGEARKAFWQEGLLPQYKRLRDKIQAGVIEEIDPNVEAEWDLSNIPALQEDVTPVWDRAIRALQAGGITVNRFLEEIGDEVIGPSGDVFLRSLNTVEVPLKTIRPIAQPKPEPDKPATDKPAATDDQNPADEPAAAEAPKAFAGGSESKKARGNAPDDEQRRNKEEDVRGVMEAFFMAEKDRIVEAVSRG